MKVEQRSDGQRQVVRCEGQSGIGIVRAGIAEDVGRGVQRQYDDQRGHQRVDAAIYWNAAQHAGTQDTVQGSAQQHATHPAKADHSRDREKGCNILIPSSPRARVYDLIVLLVLKATKPYTQLFRNSAIGQKQSFTCQPSSMASS